MLSVQSVRLTGPENVDITSTTSSDPTPGSGYVPQVGDVVTFEWNGKDQKAIIYLDKDGDLAAIGSDDWWHNKNNLKVDSLVKVDETYMPIRELNVPKAREVAKAYFAKPVFPKPVFTGSYKERQAQAVKHYGWKVGNAVRIIKGYKKTDKELDGALSRIDDTTEIIQKHSNIGKERYIREINEGIKLTCDSYDYTFPYYCLEPVD